jgi:thiol-disulfide isomerase/thioredoxin
MTVTRTPEERRYDRLYALLLIAVLLGALGVTAMSVKFRRGHCALIGDAKCYYAWARTVILDHSLDFRRSYELLAPPDPMPAEYWILTPHGGATNKYPVGVAILEIPGFLLGHFVARHLTHYPADGASPPYQIAVTWSLIIFYIVSLYFLYRAMIGFGVLRRWAFAFCSFVLLGTSLIHYICDAGMAHAGGVAVLSLLLFLISRMRTRPGRINPFAGALLGGLVGLLLLIRNTNALLLPLIVVLAIREHRFRLGDALPILAGALVIGAIQPVSQFLLWGRWRISTYTGETFSSGIHGIINTLFSHRHGLFVFTPWCVIPLFLTGYAAVRRRELRSVALAALGSFLLFVVVNGTWCCWWFGTGFGSRAFTEVFPGLALVSALVVTEADLAPRRKNAISFIILGAIALNLYLWTGYMLEAYPRDGSGSVVQVYSWPLHRLRPVQTVAAGGAIQDVDSYEFDAVVLKSTEPVLVAFWSPDNEASRAQMPIVERLGEKYSGRLKVVRLNVNDVQNLPRDCQVTALPAVAVFKNGKIVLSQTGPIDEAGFSAELEQSVLSP